MPICKKVLPDSNSSKCATEIDDHASEAAKMKRTREQAYFNSYDFDAIEVLPYESGEEDEGNNQRQQHPATKNSSTLPPLTPLSPNNRQRRLQQATRTMTRKISNSTSSGTGSCSSSSLRHERMKISYLQRLGNFFSTHAQRSAATVAVVPELHVQHSSLTAADDNSLRNINNSRSQSLPDNVAGKLAATSCKVGSEVQQLSALNPAEVSDGANFLLPRAILKYQSSVGNSNSMPPTVISATAAAPAAITHTGTSKSLQNANNINTSNRQNNAINSNSSSMVATILRPNKIRQNQQQQQQSQINSNEIGTGFQIALPSGKSATTLVRNKKISAASSTTTASTLTLATTSTTSSTRSVELIVNENAVLPTNGNTTKLIKMVKTTTTTGPTTAAATSISTHGEQQQRERVSSHQSHYSTDKSGSSGYYSSNVCSTYSIEDHIYCEPVIDVLDLNSKSKSVLNAGNNNSNNNNNSGSNNKSTTLLDQSENIQISSSRSKIMNGVHHVGAATIGAADCAEDDDDDDDDDGGEEGIAIALDNQVILRTLKRNSAAPPPIQMPHFSENLRILETSIENLDRHLKAFPSLTSQDRITSFVQATHHHQQQHQQHPQQHHGYMPHGLDERFRIYPHHLPTIMEGYDSANSPTSRAWQDIDMADDSLMDIDLDSFLLVNERGTIGKHKTKATTTRLGIDNPSFMAEELLEENNYKCAKYINSCPEDAYRVESDIIAASIASQKSTSMDYLKRYEDQIHFQNTRELLEDVRDKIRLLSRSRNELRSSSESNQSVGGAHPAVDDDELPKELDSMIKTLKSELESYLQRMNQHSELEIRQLCSGLVKNHNIVKMKKAFERRRSSIASISALESEYDFSAYEAIRDGSGGEVIATSAAAVAGMRQQQQVLSIRCASDPNFKMKRKSLTEVFPAADFYVENVREVVRSGGGGVLETQTQLQRNLSFHQPVLNTLNTQIGPNVGPGASDNALTNSGRSSGGESGEKDSIMEWHRKKPSIWEMYYGTNRMSQSLLGKRSMIVNTNQPALSYPSSRPESDFTLDLPRAEQLRIKMEKEKKFRQRCRYITSFLSLVFFLLTVMVVSLVLTRGKRMFGSMI